MRLNYLSGEQKKNTHSHTIKLSDFVFIFKMLSCVFLQFNWVIQFPSPVWSLRGMFLNAICKPKQEQQQQKNDAFEQNSK